VSRPLWAGKRQNEAVRSLRSWRSGLRGAWKRGGQETNATRPGMRARDHRNLKSKGKTMNDCSEDGAGTKTRDLRSRGEERRGERGLFPKPIGKKSDHRGSTQEIIQIQRTTVSSEKKKELTVPKKGKKEKVRQVTAQKKPPEKKKLP